MVHIQEVKDRGSRINRWQAAGRVTIYREEQLASAQAALDGRGPVIHSAVKECARPHAPHAMRRNSSPPSLLSSSLTHG